MERLLYFSLNELTLLAFHNYVKANCHEYHHSFRLVPRDEFGISHVSDLEIFLEQQKRLSHIKVIIDYVSLTCPHVSEPIRNAQESIRRLILRYPEVFFLFDETACEGFDFSDFLFPSSEEVVERFLFKEYHKFDANGEEDPFLFLDRARNNLFDGSNLRYVTKRYMYADLKVGKHNFGIVQGSRAMNLALCVEEEDGQSRFNCYSLYSNGFRALPVLSAEELRYFNEIHDKIKPQIITRDYDLQFDDIKQTFGSDYNEVDLVRGYKFYDDDKDWEILTNGYSKYWGNLIRYPVLFVTKGPDRMSVNPDNIKERVVNCWDGGSKIYVTGIHKPVPGIYASFHKLSIIYDVASKVLTCFNKDWLFRQEVAYRIFYNRYILLDKEVKEIDKEIDKEIVDINTSVSENKLKDDGDVRLESLKQRKEKFLEEQKRVIELYKKNVSVHDSDSPLQYRIIKSELPDDYIWLHQIYSLKTSRADHDHGVPLNVYDMVKEMVDRAKQYYDEKKYTRAAIVSWEAIEVMNGFHEALTLKAYHIYALSDNAIAMNVLGSKDEELTIDTQFRTRKIRADVNRILYRHQENDERRRFAKNALSQIFNDCRSFCKQREHYGSEEVFISALGHLNDSDPGWVGFLKCRRKFWDWYDGRKYERQLKKSEK